MGLFKPYDPPPVGKEHIEPPSGTSAKTPTKKGAPTPTRREAEKARRGRVAPTLTVKQAKRKAQADETRRTNAQLHNVLIRDAIDHRWHLAEFAMPVMLLLFIGVMFGGAISNTVAMIANMVFVAFFFAVVTDCVLTWREVRRYLLIYLPQEPLKGKLTYALSRMTQSRRSRRPAPEVERGTPFIWPPKHRASHQAPH